MQRFRRSTNFDLPTPLRTSSVFQFLLGNRHSGHCTHMVCLPRWHFREPTKVPDCVPSHILRKGICSVPWETDKEPQHLARNSDSTLLHSTGGVRDSGSASSGWYPFTAMSMAMENGGGTKQSKTLVAAEAPVDVDSPPRKLLTLVIIHQDGKVLLGMKKRGFGKGYYNGFGGKVEKGETIDEAAARELQEESGVTATDMDKRGILTFHFDNDPVTWEVHVYYVTKFIGEPCETEEMAPTWFPVADIPYDTMWSDDPLWYPLLLTGQQFKGEFYFTNTTTLTSHTIQVVSLPVGKSKKTPTSLIQPL